jgi:hypothetical protein
VSKKYLDTDAEMVRGILQDALGLSVCTIMPSSEHKSPDLLIQFPGSKILVEVERKTDDQQFRHLLDGEKGKTLQYSGSRTEERLGNAWHQIREYPHRNPSDSTLIWLIVGQRDATILTGKAAIARLYGLETLEGHTEKGEYYSKSCYFFYESLFFKYKDLDAVVVHSSDEVSLCLNPYSPRFVVWKAYPFLSAFSAVIDPVIEDDKGSAFFADCDTARSNTNEVVRYLRQKYKLRRPTINRFMLINMPVEP